MATMADIVKELNTPSKRDRIVVSPAHTGSSYITVCRELHRSPFVYEVDEKHFSFQDLKSAVAWAKEIKELSGLPIEGNWPKNCGLPGGNMFADWDEIPDDEEYATLIEPEEPAACLRFMRRWGRDASTRAKPYGGWGVIRTPDLPPWAGTPGEWAYSQEMQFGNVV